LCSRKKVSISIILLLVFPLVSGNSNPILKAKSEVKTPKPTALTIITNLSPFAFYQLTIFLDNQPNNPKFLPL
jgi:hypothetical protein